MAGQQHSDHSLGPEYSQANVAKAGNEAPDAAYYDNDAETS